jgi:hypothetical protein
LLALLGACQRVDRDAAPSPPPIAAPRTPGPKPGEPVDVHGITVTFRADGTVVLHGKDRWNNALDTEYENAAFFKNALPVLARSVTAEQAAGLQALATP